MSKYRKKPVVIEAEQFVIYHGEIETPYSKTIHGIMFPIYKDNKGYHILIPTEEGVMRADNLDWIISGIKGEVYPCKPEVFEKTYEKVEE